MDYPVILFDGVCNLCSNSVQFVIRHDPGHYFRFASLQGDFGQNVLQEHHLPAQELVSFILLENGKIYTRSTAVLRVCKRLNGIWPLLYAFVITPPFIRNAIYDFIAKRRYKWFGKKEECWIPGPELQQLFLS
jgi:predicted DCC family thiol-disulfide oxidoreductase YuxK